eukprot:scaffold318287_cov35-Tisochrysis_lutea.AAC.2
MAEAVSRPPTSIRMGALAAPLLAASEGSPNREPAGGLCAERKTCTSLHNDTSATDCGLRCKLQSKSVREASSSASGGDAP